MNSIDTNTPAGLNEVIDVPCDKPVCVIRESERRGAHVVGGGN